MLVGGTGRNGGMSHDSASSLNRVVLLLNVGVLVVNFFLALTATDSQIGVMQTTARLSGRRVAWRRPPPDPSAAFLRVVQALDAAAPPDALGVEQLRTVRLATDRYYLLVRNGVAEALAREDGQDGGGERVTARQVLAGVARTARLELERELATSLRDPSLVSRAATAIIRQCRYASPARPRARSVSP